MTAQKVKKINFIVEKTDTGYSAFAEEFPIYTSASSAAELHANVLEASQLFFEDKKRTVDASQISFSIDFKQFFQYYNVLNAKFLAKKIGMHPTLLSQYVSGRKKPSQKQTARILEGIHTIGQELSDVRLIYQ